MKTRFNISRDLLSDSWFLEAHDVESQRWFTVPPGALVTLMDRLRLLRVSEDEIEGVASQAANKIDSIWIDTIETHSMELIQIGFRLEPTTTPVPRRTLRR